MTLPNTLESGLTLMGYGMGFVFSFLFLMVISIGLMSRLLSRYFPQPLPIPACPLPTRPPAPIADENLPAVIAAALQRYRRRTP